MGKNIFKIIFSLLIMLNICKISFCFDEVETFEGLVKELVELEKENFFLGKEWDIEKKNLEELNDILEKEKEILLKKINTIKTNLSNEEKEFLNLKDRKKELGLKTTELKNYLNVIFEKMKLWEEILPSFTRDVIQSFYKNFKNNDGVSSKIQNILSFYSDVTSFQNKNHIKKEVIENDNLEKQIFEVIYIGVNFGLFVSQDNKRAGFKYFHQKKWNYVWDDQIAKVVKNAINIIGKNSVPKFLYIPFIAIKGGS